TINDRSVSVAEGSTILDAAVKLGIHIPTLCHINGCTPNTTCMICTVHELNRDSLILSCVMPAEDGMRIETDNEKVRESRKDTLDLLLSEHVGDCEAPCRRICPAGMNIPLMIRQIKENDLEKAIITVKKDIALPAVLGRICPAPCENGCNRKYYDSPVSICALKRFAADIDLSEESPYRPETKPHSVKKAAIIGAGPAGLSAAYYITRFGHDCTVFDSNAKPGGLLRDGVPDDKLPKSVLDAEIEQILALGVKMRQEQTLGRDFSMDDLRDEFDAVVIAFGKTDENLIAGSGIDCTSRGITVDRNTYETSAEGIFAGGNAVSEGKMAIRSAAHGKFIAHSVDQYLTGSTVTGAPQKFNSVMGKLQAGETNEFIKEADESDRIAPDGGFESGYSHDEAVKESGRCFHCDCRKPESCRLRQYSDEYGAEQKRYKFGERKPFEKIVQHELVIFEHGKCIKCNICVEITKKAGEKFGFTFAGRGFNVRLIVPFNESLENGLMKTAKECIKSCPTGALGGRAPGH
ncbi:2Fe-2S iron-sulfur cluster-binding protein, partial [Candidatus Latescibacterota bacterium]